jgi:hypothetical protein
MPPYPHHLLDAADIFHPDWRGSAARFDDVAILIVNLPALGPNRPMGLDKSE